MSTTEPGSDWLPTEALEDLEAERDNTSRISIERLLDFLPRVRVLELMPLVPPEQAANPPVPG